MTVTAIVSDIHANLPALAAVLDDAQRTGAERLWCLGDIVGYGAHPRQCVELLREHSAHIIKGNHEQATIDGPLGFNPLAAAAIRWTRNQFLDEAGEPDETLLFLTELPHRIDDPDAVLVHGSPSQPLDEYLFQQDTLDATDARDYAPKLVRSFQLIDRPCFVGHTHVPGVIDERFAWTAPSDCADGYDTDRRPCIVNVGSVGQPRDGDTRASYALFDGTTVTFRRVEYDVETAANAIFENEELPDLLGQRLLEGW